MHYGGLQNKVLNSEKEMISPDAINLFIMLDASHSLILHGLSLSSLRNENEQVSVSARKKIASLTT
uniref:Uncharacterized protein n=1 Tax=Glossina palpalis gambiensis TaxID=67801 RepID=A0A1B0ASA3_9MUSC